MVFVQIGIALMVLVVIPMLVGQMWTSCRKGRISPGFNWISGQLTLWAAFLVVTVPLVLMKKSFEAVCISYAIMVAGLFFISVGVFIYQRNVKSIRASIAISRDPRPKMEYVVWIVFLIIMLFLYGAAIAFSYADGDDSYFVTNANFTNLSNLMYAKDAYTGVSTTLDMRHVLAPFPMWVAFIARVTGFHVAIVAHVILPMVIISLFFVNVFLVASSVLEDKKEFIPLLMVLTQVLVIFGNYSIYTPENFLIARSAQGKAVIGNLVLPFLVWILYTMYQKLESDEEPGFRYFALIMMAVMAGCLCSTMATFLICMLLGIGAIYVLLCYKKWKMFFLFAVSMIVPIVLAGLYFMYR